ncbi:MAG: roadblock/LC7 domain-containing protein [Candidatus Micrarchaeota archaeon]
MTKNAESILSKLDGMNGAAIIKKDGTILASRLPSGIDAKDISEKVIGIMASSEKYSDCVGDSRITHVIIEDSNGILGIARNGGLFIVGIIGPEFDADSAASKIKIAASELQGLV